jgi:general secretion pathway protein G
MSGSAGAPGLSGGGRRRAGGFTLIEVILVLVLLGLIAAVAVPRVQDATAQARLVLTRERLGAIRRAIVGESRAGAPSVPGYLADVGRWPSSLADLLRQPAGVPAWDPFLRRGWHGPYLEAAVGRDGGDPRPTDAWGAPIHLEASGGAVRLVSPGPDGILGTGDDIALALR